MRPHPDTMAFLFWLRHEARPPLLKESRRLRRLTRAKCSPDMQTFWGAA
jgi:hypothetical protein